MNPPGKQLVRWRLALPGLFSLFPVAASAHGGLSSLGGLRALFFMVICAYAIALCIGAVVLHFVTRRRRRVSGRPIFLNDKSIPAGLRGLVLLQYVLAFIYAQAFVLDFLFPYRIETFDIVFCLVFALLAVVSANGYLKRSVNLGFRLGLILGWYCVLGACVYLYREGWGPGYMWGTLGYGILLLIALHGKYRSYFGVGEPGKPFRVAALVVRWTGLTAAFLVVAYTGSSLMVTTVFPPDEEEARKVLAEAAEAMNEYKTEHGHWPADLDELDSSVKLRYRFKKIKFDREDNELSLAVRIPLEEPDLAFRLTFGFQGRTDHIGSMGQKLN